MSARDLKMQIDNKCARSFVTIKLIDFPHLVCSYFQQNLLDDLIYRVCNDGYKKHLALKYMRINLGNLTTAAVENKGKKLKNNYQGPQYKTGQLLHGFRKRQKSFY